MKKLFIVTNSHIDPVWLWDKYEGIDEVLNTFRSVCHRLEEFPEIKFSGSSVSFYQWVKEFDIELFEKIKKYVKEGRWEVVGNWLVENDCNLPLSASFYNSARLSSEWTEKEFNYVSQVGYSPDTFGHPASLPSILSETGFKYYIFCRPGEHEKKDLPSNLFYWEHKGNKVLAYRLKYHYTTGKECSLELLKQHFTDESMYINECACYFVGLGDHGGGPTIEELKWIYELKEELKEKIEISFVTCEEFFHIAEKLPNIPTYSGDLHFHAIGCYSVNRNIKEGIRNSERALDYVQRIYDNENKEIDLSEEWAKVTFNEFHDIMPGSCSVDAAKMAVNELGGVQDRAGMLAYKALKPISAKLPLKCKQGEFRIYNSLPFDVTGPFSVESAMYYVAGAPFVRADGKEMKVQEVQASTDCNRKLMFFDTIPAKSMATYYFDNENAKPAIGNWWDRPYIWFTGNKIQINDITVKDNLNIKGVFASPIRLAVLRDTSDTWSHGIAGFNEGIEGYFRLISSSVSKGELFDAILTKWEYKQSKAEIEIRVYKETSYIDMDVKVSFLEDFKVLKLIFEDTKEIKEHIAQGPGAAIVKTTNFCEEPLHTWLKFNDKTIIQKGAFAYSKENNNICITLVRSNIFAWHEPIKYNENAPHSHTDREEHRFKFRVFYKNISIEEAEKQSQIFVEPFSVMRENR